MTTILPASPRAPEMYDRMSRITLLAAIEVWRFADPLYSDVCETAELVESAFGPQYILDPDPLKNSFPKTQVTDLDHLTRRANDLRDQLSNAVIASMLIYLRLIDETLWGNEDSGDLFRIWSQAGRPNCSYIHNGVRYSLGVLGEDEDEEHAGCVELVTEEVRTPARA